MRRFWPRLRVDVEIGEAGGVLRPRVFGVLQDLDFGEPHGSSQLARSRKLPYSTPDAFLYRID